MIVDLLVILGVSALVFAMAPVWFGPLFGKTWMKIHGWEHLSKSELKEKEKGMGKLLLIEAISTTVMIIALAFVVNNFREYSPFILALILWIGLSVQNHISHVLWGADKEEYRLHKIAILSGFSLISLLLASYLLRLGL